MEYPVLHVTKRVTSGKEVANKIRMKGLIPGVCYGNGVKDLWIIVDPKELKKAVQGPKGYNTIMRLEIKDEQGNLLDTKLGMLQDYQYHPVTRKLLHVDFYIIDLEKEIKVKVPFVLTGRAKGVQMGGTLIQIFRELPIRCKPELIPDKIEYDITELGLGQVLKVFDLKLPEGIKVLLDREQTIASIVAPEVEEEVKEGAVEEAKGKEPSKTKEAKEEQVSSPKGKGEETSSTS